MNPNIEVISTELWGVSRSYVVAGWIEELPPSPKGYSNPYASLTNDGILILNKDSEFYSILKKFVPRIMQHTDSELNKIQKALEKTSKNNYEQLYFDVIKWELERRRAYAEYRKTKIDLSVFRKLVEFFKKEGE